jgi:xanthine dehydrogenase accessory factor
MCQKQLDVSRGYMRAIGLGAGDIGSAVALHLFRHHVSVVIHDDERPTAIRRGMAFADAYFDGSATLDGVIATKVSQLSDLPTVVNASTQIPRSAFAYVADSMAGSAGVIGWQATRVTTIPDAEVNHEQALRVIKMPQRQPDASVGYL